MAKSNSFIQYLDGPETPSKEGALLALRGVPFLSHQYDWFIAQIPAKDVASAIYFMSGYTGVKKHTPLRTARMVAIVAALGAKPAFSHT